MHTLGKPGMEPLSKAVPERQNMVKPERSPLSASVIGDVRPRVRGKFLFVGEEKFYIRGVTYGPFHPDADGNEYHSLEIIERDFAQMVANGINVVRTYTTPPRSLLDAAQQYGLRVMVGLAADQYVGFLTDKEAAPDIVEEVRAKIRGYTGHPALLCYAIGNEIPASIVRWLGHRQVERLDEQAYRAHAMAELAGPEVLLHGDLWTTNVLVCPAEEGPHVRLIDWDHAGVGPISYDLSTLLYRFPPPDRHWILDVYRGSLGRLGWRLPSVADLNLLFATAEWARWACCVTGPALAAAEGAEWGFDTLASVEQWCELMTPVLPDEETAESPCQHDYT